MGVKKYHRAHNTVLHEESENCWVATCDNCPWTRTLNTFYLALMSAYNHSAGTLSRYGGKVTKPEGW